MLSFGSRSNGSNMSLEMRPGLIQLARMPSGPPSSARWAVNPITPAFAAPWAAIGMSLPRQPMIDPVLMMEPPPRAMRCGQAARVTKKMMSSSLRRLKCQASVVSELSDPMRPVEALL
jgi:hypothetical protein